MRSLLKLVSIVLIIVGAVELATVLFIIVGLGQGNLNDFIMVYGSASTINLILEAAGSVLAIACGILGCLFNKVPKVRKTGVIIGIVVSALTAMMLASNIFYFHLVTIPNVLGTTLNIILTLLYVWTLHMLKKEV